jgi:tetratricopeptide (TPR) repeat protein
MGLLDDAIKEFQTSRKDPARNTQSLTMLGLCYIDKGLFTLAVDSLEKARAAIDAKDESYWAIQYDLASAHERISEADVYVQQGLTQEAKEILETLQGIYPDNSEVEERLRRLAEMASEDESVTAPEHDRVEQDVYEIEEETPEEPAVDTSEVTQDVSPQETGAADNQGYEDLSISEEDIVEAEDVPEPVFDSDVMEVFDEFKKGLEKELGDEDSETHYNLGIAYKEMGLLDDAIKEFQTSLLY